MNRREIIMPELTNNEVKLIVNGLRSALYKKGENGRPEQSRLPMIPSIKIKRTLDDLDNLYSTITEAQEEKKEAVEDKRKELKAKVDDEDSDYDVDDLREELNKFAEKPSNEFSEFLEDTVQVEFSDPLEQSDIERLDESGNFPYSAAQAVEILLSKSDSN